MSRDAVSARPTIPIIPHILALLLLSGGHHVPEFGGAAGFFDLLAAGKGDGVRRDVAGDHRAGGDERALADHDRRHQRRVGADEGALPDPGLVLEEAVIIAGDRAGADIAAGADVGRVPNSPNHADETQLVMVVRSERFSFEEKLELIRKMVAAGADVNRPDATGDTPLIRAVRLGADYHYAVIGFGSEPNVEWRVTKSTEHRQWSAEDVGGLVGGLLAAGADRSIRDRDGKTAREIASEAGLANVAAKL